MDVAPHKSLPDDSLPVIADADRFICPGETQPVARAIHFARLKAGWPGCTTCHLNDEANSQSLVGIDGVRRTEFGVRGRYVNEIDRERAGDIAAIFAATIQQRCSRESDSATRDSGANSDSTLPIGRVCIVLGFDERLGAPDVFSGVLSAIRQCGCDVIDAGPCSHASLLNVCRQISSVDAAIIVTGAGFSVEFTGLDAFYADGQPVSVNWPAFGISTRVPTAQPLVSHLHGDQIRNALHAVRQEPTEAVTPDVFLSLPMMGRGESIYRHRSGRNSGRLAATSAEELYRTWLQRWWSASSCDVAFLVNSPSTFERLRWLVEKFRLNASVAMTTVVSQPQSDTQKYSFVIAEDDRFLSVLTKRRQVANQGLADWINQAGRGHGYHVTAHVADDGERLLLVDLAPPDAGRQYDIISDGLAVAGFVITLLQNGKNPLV